jgi:hypothetical protein
VKITESKLDVESAVNWKTRSIFPVNPGRESSRLNKGIGFRRPRNDWSRENL